MEYTITDVTELMCHTWHKDSGSDMKSRKNNGIVICDGSEFSFYVNDKEVVADERHILVLPQGANYHFICRKTGVTYTYNFCGTVSEFAPFNIETDNIAKCISCAKELLRTSERYKKIGLMYMIFGNAMECESKAAVPDIIKPQADYILANFGNAEITNSSLAAMTNISEIYFRKLFVKTMGVSPHEYITGLRIEKSKQMLLDGSTVSQTAAECGFSNLYYFSAAFKRKCGVSPSEFVKTYGLI